MTEGPYQTSDDLTVAKLGEGLYEWALRATGWGPLTQTYILLKPLFHIHEQHTQIYSSKSIVLKDNQVQKNINKLHRV